MLGWGFGVSLFTLFARILYKDINRFVNSAHGMSWRQLLWNPGTQTAYVIVFLALLCFMVGDSLNPVPEQWIDNIIKNCPAKQTVTLTGANALSIETENFMRFSLAFSMAGSYLGLIVE